MRWSRASVPCSDLSSPIDNWYLISGLDAIASSASERGSACCLYRLNAHARLLVASAPTCIFTKAELRRGKKHNGRCCRISGLLQVPLINIREGPRRAVPKATVVEGCRSEEHTSELQSPC